MKQKRKNQDDGLGYRRQEQNQSGIRARVSPNAVAVLKMLVVVVFNVGVNGFLVVSSP